MAMLRSSLTASRVAQSSYTGTETAKYASHSTTFIVAPNSHWLQYFETVVFCDCPKSIAKERYLSRKLPGRLEDDEALFNTRYQEYEELNPEVVEHFKRKGTLLEVRPFWKLDTRLPFDAGNLKLRWILAVQLKLHTKGCSMAWNSSLLGRNL